MVFRRKGMDGLHATAIAAVTSAIVYLPIYMLFLPKGLGATSWGDIALQGFIRAYLLRPLASLPSTVPLCCWERRQGQRYQH